MHSAQAPEEVENTSNGKVYISNINKNIDEETLRKKFQEFGTIRSCILKKKQNDVTYSFIQYQKPADAALAIAKLNGTEVWERNLKVQYGLGGKKGFQHYLTDAQRDKKFGENRRKINDSISSEDRLQKNELDYRQQKRRRQRRQYSRHSDSYSPEKYRRRSRDKYRRDQRDRSERRRSHSRQSRDSYYRQTKHRQRDHYKRRSRSNQKRERRRSRDKNRGYYQPYKHQSYARKTYDDYRPDKQRYRQRSPYQKEKRYSPQRRYRKYSKSSSQIDRKMNYDRKYDKARVEIKNESKYEKEPRNERIYSLRQQKQTGYSAQRKYEPQIKNQGERVKYKMRD